MSIHTATPRRRSRWVLAAFASLGACVLVVVALFGTACGPSAPRLRSAHGEA